MAAGGCAGTAARLGVSDLFPTAPGHLPVDTLLVNLTGALLLGVALESLVRRGADTGRRRMLRLVGATGFLGAFTTYSALAVEADLLVAHHRALALTYATGSVLAGLAAAAAGMTAAAAIDRRQRRQ